MTAVDVCFRYEALPGESEMRALDRLWEVYGVRRIKFDEPRQTIRVEYDATRLTEDVIASLLRRAGVRLKDKVALA